MLLKSTLLILSIQLMLLLAASAMAAPPRFTHYGMRSDSPQPVEETATRDEQTDKVQQDPKPSEKAVEDEESKPEKKAATVTKTKKGAKKAAGKTVKSKQKTPKSNPAKSEVVQVERIRRAGKVTIVRRVHKKAAEKTVQSKKQITPKSNPAKSEVVQVERIKRVGKVTVVRKVNKKEQVKKAKKKKKDKKKKEPIVFPGVQYYGANVQQAEWTVSSTRYLCKLRHTIPFFGEAEFSKGTKKALTFAIHVREPMAKSSKAVLRSVPPTWKLRANAKHLGVIPVRSGKKPIILPHGKAPKKKRTMGFNQTVNLQLAKKAPFQEVYPSRLLTELSEGMSLSLTYQDWIDGRDEVTVTISAINFQSKIEEFQMCMGSLLSYNYDKVRHTLIYFKYDSARLTAKAKRRLKQLAKFAKIDPEIKRIVIKGFTDKRGFRVYNKKLAQRRALAVKKYFSKRGVKKKMVIKAVGELKSDFPGSSRKDQQKNRRVSITLAK